MKQLPINAPMHESNTRIMLELGLTVDYRKLAGKKVWFEIDKSELSNYKAERGSGFSGTIANVLICRRIDGGSHDLDIDLELRDVSLHSLFTKEDYEKLPIDYLVRVSGLYHAAPNEDNYWLVYNEDSSIYSGYITVLD